LLGSYTIDEIRSQPEVLESVLDLARQEVAKAAQAFFPEPDEVVFTGCGSSYYVGVIAALTFRRLLGARARAVPASEVMLYPREVLGAGSRIALVGVTRSGRTTETIEAMKIASGLPGVRAVGVRCERNGECGAWGERNGPVWVDIPQASERSVVSTRSVTSMLLFLQFLAGSLGRDDSFLDELRSIPELAAKTLRVAEEPARALAEPGTAGRYVLLGSGPSYGVAREGSLKITEMACEPVEVYHSLEYRHGPKAASGSSTVAVLIPSDSGWTLEQKLIEELIGLSVRVAVVGKQVSRGQALASIEGIPSEWARPVLSIIPLQLLAYYRAVARGQDPDAPRHLSSVVTV